MISAFLAFFHARKWLAELLLIAVLVGGAWWFCAHLVDVGVQRQKDADARELERERVAAQIRQDKAERAHATEITDVLEYRAANPLHGGLCDKPASVPRPRAADGGDARPGAGAGDIQPLPAGGAQAGGRGGADVRHLLDVLAFNADGTGAELRLVQAAAPPPAK